MIQVFLYRLSYALNIHCRCTIDFPVLPYIKLSHIFLVAVPSFSMFWHLRFVPSELSSKTCSYIQNLKIITNRTFNFTFKGGEVVIGSLRDCRHTSLFLSFSSHDCLIGNTLSCFVTKVMARETLAIEEISSTIIQPIVVSTTIHF